MDTVEVYKFNEYGDLKHLADIHYNPMIQLGVSININNLVYEIESVLLNDSNDKISKIVVSRSYMFDEDDE